MLTGVICLNELWCSRFAAVTCKPCTQNRYVLAVEMQLDYSILYPASHAPSPNGFHTNNDDIHCR